MTYIYFQRTTENDWHLKWSDIPFHARIQLLRIKEICTNISYETQARTHAPSINVVYFIMVDTTTVVANKIQWQLCAR